MAEKPVIWLGTAREDLRAFPADAKQVAGFQLWRVQRGLEANDWKPLPTVGFGVREIRVHTGLDYRVVYLAKFARSEAGPGTGEAASPWTREGTASERQVNHS